MPTPKYGTPDDGGILALGFLMVPVAIIVTIMAITVGLQYVLSHRKKQP